MVVYNPGEAPLIRLTVAVYTKSHQKVHTLCTFFFAGLVPENDVSIRSPAYMTSNGTWGGHCTMIPALGFHPRFQSVICIYA